MNEDIDRFERIGSIVLGEAESYRTQDWFDGSPVDGKSLRIIGFNLFAALHRARKIKPILLRDARCKSHSITTSIDYLGGDVGGCLGGPK